MQWPHCLADGSGEAGGGRRRGRGGVFSASLLWDPRVLSFVGIPVQDKSCGAMTAAKTPTPGKLGVKPSYGGGFSAGEGMIRCAFYRDFTVRAMWKMECTGRKW